MWVIVEKLISSSGSTQRFEVLFLVKMEMIHWKLTWIYDKVEGDWLLRVVKVAKFQRSIVEPFWLTYTGRPIWSLWSMNKTSKATNLTTWMHGVEPATRRSINLRAIYAGRNEWRSGPESNLNATLHRWHGSQNIGGVSQPLNVAFLHIATIWHQIKWPFKILIQKSRFIRYAQKSELKREKESCFQDCPHYFLYIFISLFLKFLVFL